MAMEVAQEGLAVDLEEDQEAATVTAATAQAMTATAIQGIITEVGRYYPAIPMRWMSMIKKKMRT